MKEWYSVFILSKIMAILGSKLTQHLLSNASSGFEIFNIQETQGPNQLCN